MNANPALDRRPEGDRSNRRTKADLDFRHTDRAVRDLADRPDTELQAAVRPGASSSMAKT
jgi:hypothetical protein